MGVTFSVTTGGAAVPGIFSTFHAPDGNLVQVLQMSQDYRDSLPG